jgi:hypothetical protein
MIFYLSFDMVELVSNLVKFCQFMCTLVMEVLGNLSPILFERTVEHCDQLLLYSLELLFHRSLYLTLIVLQVAHNVVLFVSDTLLQAAELLLALSLTVLKVSLPRLPLAIEYWITSRCRHLPMHLRQSS